MSEAVRHCIVGEGGKWGEGGRRAKREGGEGAGEKGGTVTRLTETGLGGVGSSPGRCDESSVVAHLGQGQLGPV